MRVVHAYARLMHSVRRYLVSRGHLSIPDKDAPRARVRMWWRSLFSVFDFEDFASLGIPWWNFTATAEVSTFLNSRPNPHVFEWGSGASTLWLASRGAKVTSVESDPSWATRLVPLIPPNVTIVQAVPTAYLGPHSARSKRMGFRHLDFSSYVNTIDQTPGFFDLIVIDGRAREACLAKALERVKSDGIIVFDNTNRLRYRKALKLYSARISMKSFWGLTPILPWPSRTSIVKVAPHLAAQAAAGIAAAELSTTRS